MAASPSNIGSPAGLDVARPADVARRVPHAPAPRASEVDGSALPMEVGPVDDLDYREEYREYGSERERYADSVGMRLYEKV